MMTLKPMPKFINRVQQPHHYDDDGMAVYECHATKALVREENTIKVGSLIPDVVLTLFIENSETAKKARRQQEIDIADADGNCNTCKNLQRLPSHNPKGKPGNSMILNGRCNRLLFTSFSFNPRDVMKMPCYESRFNKP